MSFRLILMSEKDIDRSLNADGSAAYKAVVDGEIVGGAVVVINEKNPEPDMPEDFVGDGGEGMFVFEKIM